MKYSFSNKNCIDFKMDSQEIQITKSFNISLIHHSAKKILVKIILIGVRLSG